MGLLRKRIGRHWVWSTVGVALVAACGESFTSFPDGTTAATTASGSASGGASGTSGTTTNGNGGMSAQSVSASVSTVSSTQSSAMSSTGSISPVGSSSTGIVNPMCPGELLYCVNDWVTEDKMLAGIGGITADDKYLYLGANAAIYRVPFANMINPIPEPIAGGVGQAGYKDDNALLARFGKLLTSSVYDSDNKVIYVADSGNCSIRAVALGSPVVVGTLAGKPGECLHVDGSGINGTARFSKLAGLALDSPQMGPHLFLYVTDDNYVRTVAISNGATVTLAGQAAPGAANNANGMMASFSGPSLLTTTHTTVYIADTGNALLRQMDVGAPNGVSTACGSTPGLSDGSCSGNAQMKGPVGVTGISGGLVLSDASQNDLSWNTIRTITNGTLTSIAGELTNIHKVAVGNNAGVPKPSGLYYRTTNAGHELYIAETGTRVRRMIMP